MSDKVLAAAKRIVDLKRRVKLTLGAERLGIEDELDDLYDHWTVGEFALAYMELHNYVRLHREALSKIGYRLQQEQPTRDDLIEIVDAVMSLSHDTPAPAGKL